MASNATKDFRMQVNIVAKPNPAITLDQTTMKGSMGFNNTVDRQFAQKVQCFWVLIVSCTNVLKPLRSHGSN